MCQVSGGVLMMLAIVTWMKLVSYHHCCADLRAARRRGELRPGGRLVGRDACESVWERECVKHWGAVAGFPHAC